MKRHATWILFFAIFFFWVFASVANPEEDLEDQTNRIIHVHRKHAAVDLEGIQNLIVPSVLEDVESLAINPETKQWLFKF